MSRRWFRSSCVSLLLIPFLLAQVSPAAHLPALLTQVEAKYKKSPTLMAAFSQINESALLGDRKTSSGVISIKRPGKMRWETQSPDPTLFITDGSTMWFYTPPFDKDENGQLVVRKAVEHQSRLAGALLAADFSVGKDLKISEKGPNHFQVTPKPGSAGDVLDCEIFVDAKNLLIQKVILKHRGGNLTEITLTKISLGKDIEDELFHFVPPPKTSIVKE